jgi:integrase
MIRIQLLTGMRPNEVVAMRMGELDKSGPVWTYSPDTHKMVHKGRSRTIMIGPKAQEIVWAWLGDDPGAFLFPSRAADPTRRYSVDTYRRAIHRACDRAGIPRWSPNRLRHSAATKLRREIGLEAARVVLGHSDASTTTIYAESDLQAAREAMERLG